MITKLICYKFCGLYWQDLYQDVGLPLYRYKTLKGWTSWKSFTPIMERK